MNRLAAIDIGTNSVLLLIAEFQDNKLVALQDRARIARLGANVKSTGLLSEAAIAKTLNVLAEYAEVICFEQIEAVFCFSTAVLRDANNADLFQNQVKQKFGWDVEILSGEQEAQLTLVGAMDLAPEYIDSIGAIDIGGGSVEVICGNDSDVFYRESFPIGAVSLKEAFNISDGISSELRQEMETYIMNAIEGIPSDRIPKNVWVTGGTATTLAALDLSEAYDFRKVDGHGFTYQRLEGIYAELNRKTIAERENLAGMEPGRADIIVPALLLLLTLMKQMKLAQIRITVRGVRYGILKLAVAQRA
jgi:exopolyphosphatase/guanosine-5'-triphosphate,3'-diphosphate pyrophosphatase